MTDLDDRIAVLEGRLRDGFERIGAALAEGLTVDDWHAHWIDLLRQYEALNDERAVLKPEQVALGLNVRPAERMVG